MTEPEQETVWGTTRKRRRHDIGPPQGMVDVIRRDYPAGTEIGEHQHARHQLIYARSGLMVVMSPRGRWVVPTTRAIWMPAGTPHSSRCIDAVDQCNVYISIEAAPALPTSVAAVEVGPLLRRLIEAAVHIPQPYEEDSRNGRVMRLILDELHTLPILPLHLPKPDDARLAALCDAILAQPYDTATLTEWAGRTGIHSKTLQRRFASELGMTFGRWRQRARLLFALERLAAGMPVIDVAMDLGYESPSAFSAMFKRHFGLTPTQFF